MKNSSVGNDGKICEKDTSSMDQNMPLLGAAYEGQSMLFFP
ncbi:MAG: hypothetical protein WBZ36_23705 [Candidatus Nitrosopolaris sp.]